jgi:micrococcal nuclease
VFNLLRNNLYYYEAYVINIVDGQKLDVIINLGFGLRKAERIRLKGIDTPEIYTSDDLEKKAGELVKQLVKDKIENHHIILKTYKEDSFGRYLADVYLDENQTLNEYLNLHGFARPYKRGQKDWGESHKHLLEAIINKLGDVDIP